jgi:hypothetical protein
MRKIATPGIVSIVCFALSFLSACDMTNSNRPQDKRMQQQEQRLKMAIQQLEVEADRVVLEGKKLYGEASQKMQDFTGDTSASIKELSQLTDRLVQQAKTLQELPLAVEAGSQKMMAAAQAAVGYSGSAPVPAQAAKTP